MPRAEIAATQATFTLEKLHQELAGKIIDNRSEARRLAQSMRHVEAVLIDVQAHNPNSVLVLIGAKPSVRLETLSDVP